MVAAEVCDQHEVCSDIVEYPTPIAVKNSERTKEDIE